MEISEIIPCLLGVFYGDTFVRGNDRSKALILSRDIKDHKYICVDIKTGEVHLVGKEDPILKDYLRIDGKVVKKKSFKDIKNGSMFNLEGELFLKIREYDSYNLFSLERCCIGQIDDLDCLVEECEVVIS